MSKRNPNEIFILTAVVLLFFIVFKFCTTSYQDYSSTTPSSSSPSITEGLDKVIQTYDTTANYTILLNDMDYNNNKYLHKYQVIVEHPDGTFSETKSDWQEVSSEFFRLNQKNLGMELAHKTDGKLSKKVVPAGYSKYIDNEKYGKWENQNNESTWAFLPRYILLATYFHLLTRPARERYYRTYRTSYYNSPTIYYGSGYYGSGTYAQTGAGKSATWTNRSSDFKQRVRNRVQQSRSVANNPSRTSRSGSRYSSSPSRSRSGGFGGK